MEMRDRSSGVKRLRFCFFAAVVLAVLGFLPPAAMATGLRLTMIKFRLMILMESWKYYIEEEPKFFIK